MTDLKVDKPSNDESNKENKLKDLLDKMMSADMELYEKILDTPGFAFYFNELCNLAKS